METIPPPVLDAVLAHPALAAVVALLLAAGVSWTFRPAAPVEMVARQMAEAATARAVLAADSEGR